MPDEDTQREHGRRSSPLPGMLGRLHAGWLMLRDPDTPRTAKLGVVVLGLGAALLVLAYGVSPFDLLPELFLGPAGLIDDLIIIPLLLWLLSRFMPRGKARRILAKFGRKPGTKPDTPGTDAPNP